MRLLQHSLGFIFYGNIFYAACTVLLCIETNLVAGFGLNHPAFYLAIGAATLLFYGIIYYRGGKYVNLEIVAFDWQSRLHWYSYHRGFIRILIWLGLFLLAASGAWYLGQGRWQNLTISHYFLALLFPLVAIAYSYKILPFSRLSILREAGLLKPFILGFAWAGFVTVFPMIGLQFEDKLQEQSLLPFWWLFIQNLIYISVLCILFDIKDRDADSAKGINTFPVTMGTTRTIWLVVLPLIVFNLLIKFLYFSQKPHFIPAVLLRSLPYLLMIPITLLVTQKRSTLFYLAVVDGLMLVKALLGILSITRF